MAITDDDRAEIGKIAAARTRAEIRQIAEKNGLVPEMVIEAVKQALQAISQKEFCTKDGRLVFGLERIDHSIRLQAAKMAAEFLDMIPAKQSEIGFEPPALPKIPENVVKAIQAGVQDYIKFRSQI
jgi:hypothetical protein